MGSERRKRLTAGGVAGVNVARTLKMDVLAVSETNEVTCTRLVAVVVVSVVVGDVVVVAICRERAREQ